MCVYVCPCVLGGTAGVERALLGHCPGTRLRVVIPPHLAFDAPDLPIKGKPVPDGATVCRFVKGQGLRKRISFGLAFSHIF